MAAFEARYRKLRVRTIGAYLGHQWDVPPGALAEIAEWLELAGPFPEAGYPGPTVVVQATWRLTLLDPATHEPLPHQSSADYLGFAIDADRQLGSSLLHGRIAGRTTAHLFLSLPFDAPSAEARGVAAQIRAAFPARLSASHWKQWRLTAAGNRYVGRKTEALV